MFDAVRYRLHHVRTVLMKLLVLLIPAAVYAARESAPTFGCSNDQSKPERLSEMHEWDSLQRMNGVGARRLTRSLVPSTV